MSPESIAHSFAEHGRGAEIVIVEGNRGLYDGVDPEGSYSTAELALLLNLPVLLVVDCTKTTRTVAALVLGCKMLDPRVRIAGVVLNRIGSSRHEKIVRQAVEQATGIPVVGAVRRLLKDVFPMRHLGVTPHQEYQGAGDAIAGLAQVVSDSLDLGAVEKLLQPIVLNEIEMGSELVASIVGETAGKQSPVRIGVLKDAAFQFYYPDNLEALEKEGAELVEINALIDSELPDLDGLYIGGGFPETSAGALSANTLFRRALRQAVEDGLPVYAECGGLIYLGESIELDGQSFPLVGVFPVRFGLSAKPQAHGYTILTVEQDNPFYPIGLQIKGHEFRYSQVLSWTEQDLALAMNRGKGFARQRDGLVRHNTLALYTHVHALGTPEWAVGLVARARTWRAGLE